MTFAPGKVQLGSLTGVNWKRDVGKDLATLKREYQTDVLVSLMQEYEYKQYSMQSLFDKIKEFSIEHVVFPIADCHIPTDKQQFHKLVENINYKLNAGQTVIVHCLGGLGRTGLLCACCLLLLNGYEPEINSQQAIKLIRTARKGTIQTYSQVRFVEDFLCENPKEQNMEDDSSSEEKNGNL